VPPGDVAPVSSVETDRVSFRVELQGGIQALEQAIRLNPRIMPTSRLSNRDAEAVYTYRWQQQ